AGARRSQLVERRYVAVRTGRAERRASYVDDVGSPSLARIVVETARAQPGFCAIGDHDVGLRRQLGRELASRFAVEVDRDAPLVAVRELEQRVPFARYGIFVEVFE